MSQPDPRIVIVGGGLAGIAAGVLLADAGRPVTLVETRGRLGGRATSFTDPATGQDLDNCQHVLMGACTALLDLYARLGVLDDIAWHRRIHFAHSGGLVDAMEADDLPAPAHLTAGLMGLRFLSLAEKAQVAVGMRAMLRLPRAARADWHSRSFADYLRAHGQGEGVIRRFWGMIVVSALNADIEQAAADYAIQVFQEGFLAHEDAYVMGLARGPLVRLYDRAERAIAAAGGRVLLSTSAERFEFDAGAGRVTGLRLADGSVIPGDTFIASVPPDRLAKLTTPAMLDADPRLRRLGAFAHSPILGIHLWFAAEGEGAGPEGHEHDTGLVSLPHAALVDSPLHWVFNKGVEDVSVPSPAGPVARRGLHLHGVISAAGDLVDRPAEVILAKVVAELRNALPGLASAELLHGKVIKERRATFACVPGVDALRPPAAGPIGNLLLAGDWCRSGWPATMEGAVRSGYLAAWALLGDAAPPFHDLPAGELHDALAAW